MRPVQAPRRGDDWFALTADELSVAEAYDWAQRADCGAVVVFSGTVRDHAEGREGVEQLEYEAYEEAVQPRLAAIAAEARRRWPSIGRVALLHRIGRLTVGESSVLVVVSSPHRPEAFEAARYAIDALKASVPIWKHETWREGSCVGHGRHADPRCRGRVVTALIIVIVVIAVVVVVGVGVMMVSRRRRPGRRGRLPAPHRRPVARGATARRRSGAAARGRCRAAEAR